MRRRVKLSPWLLRMERDCLVGCGCAAPSLPFIQSRKVSEGPRFIERLCEGATPGGYAVRVGYAVHGCTAPSVTFNLSRATP
jgi:hypothetical protein